MTHKTVISLLVALLVFVITIAGYMNGYFEKPEFFAYDTQAKLLRSGKPVDTRIKVILVDEAALKSLAEIAGRWPWPNPAPFNLSSSRPIPRAHCMSAMDAARLTVRR